MKLIDTKLSSIHRSRITEQIAEFVEKTEGREMIIYGCAFQGGDATTISTISFTNIGSFNGEAVEALVALFRDEVQDHIARAREKAQAERGNQS